MKLDELYKIKKSDSKELYIKYHMSLKQKYNAVCLDIDGTLTKSDNIEDLELISIICDLLRKDVPIVFITGRGRTGTKSFVENLFTSIKNNHLIEERKFQNVFALVNDGTLLLSSDDNCDKYLNNETILVKQNKLSQLSEFDNMILSNIYNQVKKTYSFSKTGDILNIRFVFDENTQKEYKDLYIDLQNLISQKKFTKTNLSFGYWKENKVLQVGLSNKSDGIKTAENIIGVPENSMLRVGDCGDANGNDYEFLNCKQGYSVSEYSDSIFGCYPVINNNGQILKGINATKYLLKTMNILPTVCLEKANKRNYKKEYAKIEQKLNFGTKSVLEEYNNKLINNFNLINGFNDLFEKNIGGIILPFYEWELISEDNLLKQLFDQKDQNNIRTNSLFTNNEVLLRGSNNYYYFLKERVKNIDGNEPLTYNMVLSWHFKYTNFFIKSTEAVNKESNLNSIYNKKMILGILDNIRNYLLVNINALLMTDYYDNYMLNLSLQNDNKNLFFLYNLAVENVDLMKNVALNNELNTNKLNAHMFKITNISRKLLEKFCVSDRTIDYAKIYRVYREIDNFMENFIAVDLATKNHFNDINVDNTGIVGLLYGGLEIPIIFKSNFTKINDVSVLKFSSAISSYKRKQAVEVRNFNIKDYGGLNFYNVDKNKQYIIADDNLLTAKTMQLALNTMYDEGIDVKKLLVIRYPSLNRVDQMFMDGHGAVDYKFFFNLIIGLAFPSPYSYMDVSDSYLDSLGIFDNTRQRILEILYKNHDYQKESEVSLIKKFK